MGLISNCQHKVKSTGDKANEYCVYDENVRHEKYEKHNNMISNVYKIVFCS